MDPTTRKLQKVGGGTYTISVPKEWATSQDLHAGATVDIYPGRNSSIIVTRTNTESPLANSTIELTDDSGAATCTDRLHTAYTAGYETITLTNPSGFSPGQRRSIRVAATRYNGLEVVTETETELTVTDVLDQDAISIEQTLTRLQFIALSRLRGAVATLDGTTPTGVDDGTDGAMELTNRVIRYTNRAALVPAARDDVNTDATTLAGYRDVARELASIASHAHRIETLDINVETNANHDHTDHLSAAGTTVVGLVDDATTAILGAPSQTLDRATAARTQLQTLRDQLSRLDDAHPGVAFQGAYELGRVRNHLESIGYRGESIAAIAQRTAHRTGHQESRPSSND